MTHESGQWRSRSINMSERKYSVPQFSQFWTKMGVPERRGVWDGKPWSDLGTQIDPPEPKTWDRARRARPTIWAHPAAFSSALRRRSKSDAPLNSMEVQLWAGLLAALYKGDLGQQQVDLRTVDPDLPAAFREGLPFDPSQWPREVGALHGPATVTVYRSPGEPRPIAIGYAPSILVPSLWLWEAALEDQLEKSYQFSDLMQHYRNLEGFGQGLQSALEGLIGQRWPEHWFHELLVTLKDEISRWHQGKLSTQELEASRSPDTNPLGFRWGGRVDPLRTDVWRHYPLRTDAGDGSIRLVFIVDGGLDEALNPWMGELAFPGSGDTETRIRDLAVSAEEDSMVLGLRDQQLPLPADHRVISLNPRAAARMRLLRSELVHLVGKGACLEDQTPLHPVHDTIHQVMARGYEATSLLPLDGAFLTRYPELREGLLDSFAVRNGVALPQASATGEVSVQLPVPRQFELVWRPHIVTLKGDGTIDLVPRADLWPDFQMSPSNAWNLYLLRILEAGDQFRLIFPELDLRAQLGWDGQEALVIVSDRPPTLVELADFKDPNNTHGTLVLDPGQRLKKISRDPNKNPSVAIDFGTTNTSVAFRSRQGEEPEVLEFRERTLTLIQPQTAEEGTPTLPGWVFDEGVHKGFFSTAIGVKESFKQDQPPSHQQILEGRINREVLQILLNASEISGLKLSWLAGVQDNDGLQGKWEFYDQLKWKGSTADQEADNYRLTLRSCFMAHLLLHTLAEIAAQTAALPKEWIFTHPLSMRWKQVEDYENDVRRTLEHFYQLVSPNSDSPKIQLRNESDAIFGGFIQHWGKVRFPSGQRVVIADMGGGTVDFAVFTEHERKPRLVRADSLRLAGQHFFEFIGDIKDQPGKDAVQEALKIHFSKARSGNVARKAFMGKESFRQAFNWTLVGTLTDKSGKDSSNLSSNLRQLAEERAPLRDEDHLALWLGRLVRAVLGHAVLLGSAPLESESERLSELEIVLAGNGWSLLPYCGHQTGDDSDLGAVAERALSILRDLWAMKGREFRGPSTVKVRPLEKAVGGLPPGVYSKDLVAVGALAPVGALETIGNGNQHTTAGILGADLKLTTSTNGGNDVPSTSIPWFKTSLPDSARRELEAQGTQRDRSFFDRHSTSGGNWSIVADTISDGPEDAKVDFRLAEQLFIYALLDPKGKYPQGRTQAQVEDWNGAFEERVEEWLRQINAGATSTDYDRTSLIRGLWEYYFIENIRPALSRK